MHVVIDETDGAPSRLVGRSRSRGAESRDPDPTFAQSVEALYRVDAPRLWRAMYAFSASRSIADDAVSEAFVQVLRRGDGVLDPRAWVWRAAYRIASGMLAEQRRTVNEIVVDLAYEPPDSALDIVAALRDLSPAQRAAVILNDYAGYRAREVAEMIGSTEAAVRVHLMRGRRKLRNRLEGAP